MTVTEDELTETTPAPRTVAWGWKPAAIVAGLLALLFFVLWLLAGLPGELSESDKREIRICEMSKAMGGASVYEAEVLCSRDGWQR